MTQQHHQNHATWECKYHVVFIPKYRKKAIFGVIKKRLGDVFHELARRRESKIEEGHLMPDHVHMLISIPPKYSVAEVIGFMKGKSSIWIAQNVERKARNFTGHKFWARGYFVSTVGRDEEMIRAYIKNQEMQDRELDQLSMIPQSHPKSSRSPLKPLLAVPHQTTSLVSWWFLIGASLRRRILRTPWAGLLPISPRSAPKLRTIDMTART